MFIFLFMYAIFLFLFFLFSSFSSSSSSSFSYFLFLLFLLILLPQGWGKEDVDLVDRFLNSDVKVMRSVDRDLTHIYHPISCDSRLEAAQFKMCQGTLSSNYASLPVLSQLLSKRRDLLSRRPDLHRYHADAPIAKAPH